MLHTGGRAAATGHATGYFTPEVWNIVEKAFNELKARRLLLGERPEVTQGGPATVDLRRYYRLKMTDDLEKPTRCATRLREEEAKNSKRT